MATLVALVLGSLVLTALGVLAVGWCVRRSLRRLRARLSGAMGAVLERRAVAVERPRTQALRKVSRRREAVVVRSWLPGQARAVAALRRDLHRDVRGAAEAVAVGLEAGRPVQPLAAIASRLQRSAASIDVDLAIVGAEPDPSRRRALLEDQQARIETVQRACEQVRRGVLLAGSVTTGPLLPGVVDDLNDEVIRLGLWARAHHELHGH